MKHADVIETEYKEQYQQYRWIGQMQSVVLTLYAAVTTFALAATAALRPESPTPIDYRWPAGVMIGLGLLGVLVGYGLFRSRTMQRRTAWYLASLLIQLAGSVEDREALSTSALRFRSLCSTRGRFKLWDTTNTAILVALYSGEALFLTGVLVFSVHSSVLPSLCAVITGLLALLVLFALTPIVVQSFLINPETKRLEDEYLSAAKTSTLEEMGRQFGLPDYAPQSQGSEKPPA
jgi:hypothetical protein